MCIGTDLKDMNQLSASSDKYDLHQPSPLTTASLDNVNQTSVMIPATSDPLNVIGQVGGIVISLTIIIGVVGNLLVLTAIIQCPQLRRSYNAFIASLSVTDLIFNITVMPFYVEAYCSCLFSPSIKGTVLSIKY